MVVQVMAHHCRVIDITEEGLRGLGTVVTMSPPSASLAAMASNLPNLDWSSNRSLLHFHVSMITH